MKALAIGGVADHVHLLLSLPATLSISKAMQLLKGNSSKWLRETFPELRPQGFAWQEGFGAFSIGISGVADTVRYIQIQEEHHRRKGFSEELEVFLERHGYDYKPEMSDRTSFVPAGLFIVIERFTQPSMAGLFSHL